MSEWFCNDVQHNPVQCILDCIQCSVDEGYLLDEEGQVLESYIVDLIRDGKIKVDLRFCDCVRFYY